MSFKHLCLILALFCFLAGAALVCLMPGGFFNRLPPRYHLDLSDTGPGIGLFLLAVGFAILIAVVSLSGTAGQPRQRLHRALGGLALFFAVVGAYGVCLSPGGLFNSPSGGINTDEPGPLIGLMLLGAATVAFGIHRVLRPDN